MKALTLWHELKGPDGYSRCIDAQDIGPAEVTLVFTSGSATRHPPALTGSEWSLRVT